MTILDVPFQKLKKAWSGSPRPEIKSTFLLGIAEGVLLSKQHNADVIMNLVDGEIKQAHAALKLIPKWKRWFIRA